MFEQSGRDLFEGITKEATVRRDFTNNDALCNGQRRVDTFAPAIDILFYVYYTNMNIIISLLKNTT